MMSLHNNFDEFKEIIQLVSQKLRIDESIVEKDYYVTLFLKEIFEYDKNFVFKGGTSLSKCFKIIDRFSEDIDICYSDNSMLTQGRKRQIKKMIVDIVGKYDMNMIMFEAEVHLISIVFLITIYIMLLE